MKITDTMVNELNDELNARGCAFRYNTMAFAVDDNVRIVRVPMSDIFLSSAILNCTAEFYEFLDNFFRERGINKLSYNNDGSICWSASGWNDIGDMTEVRCISEREGSTQIKVGQTYYICESSRWFDCDNDAYVEVYADPEKKQYIGNMLEAHFEKI